MVFASIPCRRSSRSVRAARPRSRASVRRSHRLFRRSGTFPSSIQIAEIRLTSGRRPSRVPPPASAGLTFPCDIMDPLLGTSSGRPGPRSLVPSGKVLRQAPGVGARQPRREADVGSQLPCWTEALADRETSSRGMSSERPSCGHCSCPCAPGRSRGRVPTKISKQQAGSPRRSM